MVLVARQIVNINNLKNMKIKVWIMEYDVKKTRGQCSRDVDEM